MQQENMKTLKSLEDFHIFRKRAGNTGLTSLRNRLHQRTRQSGSRQKALGMWQKQSGSLGVLEEDIVRGPAAQGEEVPDFSKRAL